MHCFFVFTGPNRFGAGAKTNQMPGAEAVAWNLSFGSTAMIPASRSETLVSARETLHVVLPFTHHQCSIHCESSRVARGASKRRWASQTTRDTSIGVQSEYHETFVHISVVRTTALIFSGQWP